MTELSPVQVALRELMILTKCYCGNYGEDPHPRLGHNCSFRRDVETVVAAVGDVLKLCEAATVEDRAGHQVAFDVRRALLGLEPMCSTHGPHPGTVDCPECPPWREDEPFYPCEHGGTRGTDYCRLCEQVAPGDNDGAASDVSDGEGGASVPG